MKKNKGYVILIILILSIIIAIIGAGLAFMSKQGYLSTRANTLFNRLQKAAHYGINEATRRIVEAGGFCEELNVNENLNLDGVNVKVGVARRGILCALRSEANLGGGRAVIVASTQGFYGIGTYTTKGLVNANLERGGLISGCDRVHNCFIPGFITQGDVSTNAQRGNCANVGNRGVYGVPDIKEKVPFHDLTPLAFNVNCFGELLWRFESEDNYEGYPMGLGSNPLWKQQNEKGRQDIEFYVYTGSESFKISNFINPETGDFSCTHFLNNFVNIHCNSDEANCKIGDMRIIFPDIPTIPPSCKVETNKNMNLNLSNMHLSMPGEERDLSNCVQVLLNPRNNTLNISGVASTIKYIYTTNNRQVIISGAKNGILINFNSTSTVEVNSNFEPFSVYSKGPINLNNVSYLRAVSESNIYLLYPHIRNSILITRNSIIVNNDLTSKDLIIFAKRIDFGTRRNINIEGGMLYLYTLADQVRTNNRVLYGGCNWGSNPVECAWYGTYLTSVTIGTPSNPVLIILINSATYIGNTVNVSINGVLFGESVTYLTWSNVNAQDYQGILIRNFPNNETLNIRISDGFSLRFNYGIINILNTKYWFVRKFECIKDDPLPHAQIIQTLHSSY